MDQLAKIGPFAALIKLWNELSPAQRVVVGAFGALSLVTVVLIGMAVSKPRMSVLFSGLEAEDAGAIVQKLSEQKVPYELSADGSTVEVPENKVYDIRLQMATSGLPQGGSVGFELFDKSNFGMTEFTQRLNFQRAIQGELTRTICQLAPVASARVHIAMPDAKLYESEQQPVTASVVLKLRRGMPLMDEQVGGIVHLVASAVEGLKPSNITVVDSQGTVLSEATAGSAGGGLLTSNQSKLKRQYESELSQNLQSMLTRIVGPDKAVVRVSADMSFDQKQTKSETYEPLTNQAGAPQGVLLSEEKKTETYSGSVAPTGGVPGGRNRPAAPGDNYSRNESNSQYQVTKKIEETVSAPGQVSRLSVAVLVDDKVPAGQVAAIKDAVSAAAGISSTRGDQITVQRMTFDTVTQKAEAAEMAKVGKSEMISSVAKNAGAVILLLGFLFFLRTIVKQIKVQAPAPAPAPAFNAVSPDLTALLQTANAQPANPLDRPGERLVSAPRSDDVPSEVSQSNPEELAKLVRSWMSDN